MDSTIAITSNGDQLRRHGSLPSKPLLESPQTLPNLREGIIKLLSRWNGLELAIQNQWGGRDSLRKAHQLADDIFSWFSHQTAPLYLEDVESFLHERLLLSFSTEIEDGSIEEVAEELIVMHEEYLHDKCH